MKILLIAFLLASSPDVIEPGYRMGGYNENPSPMPGTLKALGARWEMDYRTLRPALLKAGWGGIPREYSHPTVFGFPEVNCGLGWQAVCWSMFHKNGRGVFLQLHPTDDGRLILIGAE